MWKLYELIDTNRNAREEGKIVSFTKRGHRLSTETCGNCELIDITCINRETDKMNNYMDYLQKYMQTVS